MQFTVFTYPSSAADTVSREDHTGLEPAEACGRFIQFLQLHGIDPGEKELSDRAAFVIDTTGTAFCVGYWDDDEDLSRIPELPRVWVLLRAWVAMRFPIYVDRYPANVRAGEQPDFVSRSLMFHRDPNAATPRFALSVESIRPPGLVFSPWRVDIGDELESWTFETPGYSGFVGVDGDEWIAVASLLPGTHPAGETSGQIDPATGRVACRGMILGAVDTSTLAGVLSGQPLS